MAGLYLHGPVCPFSLFISIVSCRMNCWLSRGCMSPDVMINCSCLVMAGGKNHRTLVSRCASLVTGKEQAESTTLAFNALHYCRALDVGDIDKLLMIAERSAGKRNRKPR